LIKLCALVSEYVCERTTKFHEKLKSAQRDTNLRAGTLQPDRTF